MDIWQYPADTKHIEMPVIVDKLLFRFEIYPSVIDKKNWLTQKKKT